MSRFIKKTSKNPGSPPGTLTTVSLKKEQPVKMNVIDFTADKFEEKNIENIEESFALKDTSSVSWINIDGLNDVEIIEKAGKHFGLHPLTQEDILHTGQRPKLEDFDNYLYIVLKMLSFDKEQKEILAEQVSIVLGANYVLSFQEAVGDVFTPIRERIRNNKGRIRKMGNDYLAYALIDTVVDNYFIILEGIGEKIEALEEELLKNPTLKTLHAIHNLKRELLFLRKSVWPLRELVNGLQRGESRLIQATTNVYLRDVYDHTIQVIDTIETFRDVISGMLDMYLSSVSNKMNEVMKVLTIFAAIFIPLTFMAGIYGMNFKYMPELEWKWGYYTLLLVMLSIGTAMVFYFRKKKWF